MKRAVILCLCVAALFCSASTTQHHAAIARMNAGGGPSLINFSDDFDRADSGDLGSDWHEVGKPDGDVEIAGNEMNNATTVAYKSSGAIFQTATATGDQYINVTLTESTSFRWARFMFRATDTNSPYYEVSWSIEADLLSVTLFQAFNSNATNVVANKSLSIGWNDKLAATASGTGTDVIFNFWVNPTGDTPTDFETWGGAAPDLRTTNEHATAYTDVGRKVGFFMVDDTADRGQMDNFFGGDLP